MVIRKVKILLFYYIITYNKINMPVIYCGNNRLDRSIVSGSAMVGTRYKCLKKGFGAGFYSPVDLKFLEPYSPFEQRRIYCGDKNVLPRGYTDFGSISACFRKGYGSGKRKKATESVDAGARRGSRRVSHKVSRKSRRVSRKSRRLSRRISRKVSRKSRRVSRTVSRKVSRKSRRSFHRVSRKVSRKASRRVSRKASRKASSRVSRKESRKASRKASRKISHKASRKASSRSRKSRKISRKASPVKRHLDHVNLVKYLVE